MAVVLVLSLVALAGSPARRRADELAELCCVRVLLLQRLAQQARLGSLGQVLHGGGLRPGRLWPVALPRELHRLLDELERHVPVVAVLGQPGLGLGTGSAATAGVQRAVLHLRLGFHLALRVREQGALLDLAERVQALPRLLGSGVQLAAHSLDGLHLQRVGTRRRRRAAHRRLRAGRRHLRESDRQSASVSVCVCARARGGTLKWCVATSSKRSAALPWAPASASRQSTAAVARPGDAIAPSGLLPCPAGPDGSQE